MYAEEAGAQEGADQGDDRMCDDAFGLHEGVDDGEARDVEPWKDQDGVHARGTEL